MDIRETNKKCFMIGQFERKSKKQIPNPVTVNDSMRGRREVSNKL